MVCLFQFLIKGEGEGGSLIFKNWIFSVFFGPEQLFHNFHNFIGFFFFFFFNNNYNYTEVLD